MSSQPERSLAIVLQLEEIEGLLQNVKNAVVEIDPSIPPTQLSASWIEGLIKARERRNREFGTGLFFDPGWDLLLQMFADHLRGEARTISQISEHAGLTGTTGLRWFTLLEEQGLVRREKHPSDRRAVYMFLTKSTIDAMNRYFAVPQESVAV